MYFFQRRDPNKERFWKKIVDEGDRWKFLYLPLVLIDKIVLFCIPFFGSFVLECGNN